MDKKDLEQSLFEVKKGNELAREQLIRYYKPYMIHTVGHLCKRYVSWSDDEASIGLTAFNRAIDTYDCNGGRSFLNYGYLLIKRELIDYYRREKKEQHLSLNYSLEDDETIHNQFEGERSVESYHQSVQSYELVEEILELDQALTPFKISFEELEHYSPQHRDTRQSLLEMAATFVQDQECVQDLFKKKRFPMVSFTEKTGYRPKTIERHRKYLITVILLKLHPQWVHLSAFIQGLRGKEGS